MEIRLLPIGTVAVLKESEARVMIIGYGLMEPSHPGQVWDYSGLPFPGGYQDENQILAFDEEQIEYILGMGYQDQEQLVFIYDMNQALELLKETAKEKEIASNE
ncbi:MAG: DUF4176 domain-containing protein [Lachnospiraceae bacterium]|nr:DUF4176 domain-containing protein [Lachnospiraceae bacterium]